MFFDILAAVGVLLLIVAMVIYPRIQEARERAAVERLQGNHDPATALAEVERLRVEAQGEAGFFRFIGELFGPRPRL